MVAIQVGDAVPDIRYHEIDRLAVFIVARHLATDMDILARREFIQCNFVQQFDIALAEGVIRQQANRHDVANRVCRQCLFEFVE